MPTTVPEQKDPPVTFDYLAKHRKLLREFCRFHVPSLMPFASTDLAIFGVTLDKKPTEFRHITSTSTCFSSLDLCPDELGHGKKSYFQELGITYADSAINADLKEKWRSDKAAEVYCSCRGLPFVLMRLKEWHPKIDEHIKRIIFQLEPLDGGTGDASRFGEARPPDRGPKPGLKLWTDGTRQMPTTPIGPLEILRDIGRR